MCLADRRLATRTETRKRSVARKTEKHLAHDLAHVPPPPFSPGFLDLVLKASQIQTVVLYSLNFTTMKVSQKVVSTQT